ncbi:MAG: hypothetical protein MEQ84_11255 [Mesorhizobium sp.]|nr:hypothetical protein [Mesorhizobium sp.]
MAKGQKKSNKEIRKPKKEKGAAAPESSFANQIKSAENASSSRPKGKP